MSEKAIQLRYAFEHNILPELLFTDPKKITLYFTVIETNVYVDFFKHLFEEENEEFNYNESDFSIDRVKLGEIYCIIINLPTPEQSPLCERIYILFDKDCEKVKYFTVEKDMEIFSQDQSNFLCGWDKDKNHLNYGPIPKDIDKEMEIMMIYSKY